MMPVIIKCWPVMFATAMYVAQTVILCWTRDWAGAITFVGYALANIGLIWSLS
jgi:hypothetical protein